MSTHRSPRGQSAAKGHKDREIARLRRELAEERRHTAQLERQVSALKKELQISLARDEDSPWRRLRHRPRPEDQLRETAARRAHRYRKGSYLRYLWEAIMESWPIRTLSWLLTYLRRLRVVRLVITIVLAIGAVAVVTVVSAAVLPFLLFGAVGLAMLAAMRSRRMNAILRSNLEGRHIRVLIPTRGTSLAPDAYFIRHARAMAADDGAAVIIVTPYLLSAKGPNGRRAFFTARTEGGNLYLVRRHYYFILRRHVLDAIDTHMTVVY